MPLDLLRLTQLPVLALSATLLVASAPSAEARSPRAKKGEPAAKAGSSGKGDKGGDTKAEAKVAAAPPKPTTFDEALAGAEDAGDLGNLLEPLYAECASKKSDIDRRQCEVVKGWHLDRLRVTKYHAVADAAGLHAEPIDATMGTATVIATGCVSCVAPPTIAGAPRLLATKAPKGMDGTVPLGIDIASYDLPVAKEKIATWGVRVLARLRVEHVFMVGAPFDEKTGKGVTLVPIAHRLFNVCSGEVLQASLPGPSKLTKWDRDPACPAIGAPTEEELDLQRAESALPDSLTQQDIAKAMEPAQNRIYECGEEFELKGIARVNAVVNGDGKDTKFTIDPPHDKGESNLCIRAALREVKFPRFKTGSPPVKFAFPFVLKR